jgi:hypothetical protein
MAVATIFVNLGFVIMDSFGVFPSMGYPGILSKLQIVFNPIVIGGLAVLFAIGTTVFANATFSDRGQAYIQFSLLFWGSWGITSLIFTKFLYDPVTHGGIPGFEIFYAIYTIACCIIFAIGMIQMPIGGMRMNV